MRKILVFHYGEVAAYPPVLSLVQNLLHNNNEVELISFDGNKLNEKILKNPYFKHSEINFFDKSMLYRHLFLYNNVRKMVEARMKDKDILWTTTDYSVRVLGDIVLKYKHVMQLMELVYKFPKYQHLKNISFPLDKYARAAWKVVVPEENRAYIQKAWWHLEKVPDILPNKPYTLSYSKEPDVSNSKIKKYFNEKRKIIFYLGYIGPDRNLDAFAEAVRELDDKEYCLYILGKVANGWEKNFKEFLDKYPFVEYLGYVSSPNHLAFLRNAYIGILPYYVNDDHPYLPSLNALYCAPNKLYEYSGYAVPMVGTNVLGLKVPFDFYKIGMCCKDLSVNSVADTIKKVDENHDLFSENCKTFFNNTDLDGILENILNEN